MCKQEKSNVLDHLRKVELTLDMMIGRIQGTGKSQKRFGSRNGFKIFKLRIKRKWEKNQTHKMLSEFKAEFI